MKIGYVFSNLLLGGVQTYFSDFAVKMSKINEVKYTVLSMKLADPIVIKSFKNLERVSPDELVEWSDVIQLDGMVSNEDKRKFKKKWNRTIEYFGSKRSFGLFERLFKRNLPPYLLAVTEHVGDSLKVKHRVIYCGIDTERFKPMDIEKKYDLVIIGRMRAIKNHALFLEICRKGDFSFVAIGGTHRRLEGHVNDIEKMVRAQAVEGRDYVPGFVPDEDVVPLINQARMGVITSHSEGGQTSLEPMACGVPTVSRRLEGGLSAYKEYPELLVPYDAPAEAYVEKIEKYIDDIELRKKVRQTVVEKFNIIKTIDEYNELYKEVHHKALSIGF